MDKPPEWELSFISCLNARNRVETDSYVEIFSAYYEKSNQLQNLHTTQNQWTRIASSDEIYLSEDVHFQQQIAHADVKESVNSCHPQEKTLQDIEDIEACNLLLRNQVQSYEKTLHAMDVEIKASHTCLRELESEMKDRDFQIKILDSTVEDHIEEISKLKAENFFLHRKLELLQQQFKKNSSHTSSTSSPAEPFIDVIDIEGHLSDVNSTIKENNQLVLSDERETERKKNFFSLYKEKQLTENSFTKKNAQRYNYLFEPKIKLVAKPHNGAVTCLSSTPLLEESSDSTNQSAINNKERQRILASGGYDGFLAILNLQTLTICYSFKVHDSSILFVSLSLDQKYAVVAASNCFIYIADLDHQCVINSIPAHSSQARITGIRFLYPFQWNHQLKISTLKTVHSKLSQTDLENRIMDSITNTPLFCFSVATDKIINIWSINKIINKVSLTKTPSPVTCSYLHKNRKLLLGHQNGCITVWVLKINLAFKEAFDSISNFKDNSNYYYSFLKFESETIIRPLAPLPKTLCAGAVHEGIVTGIYCFCQHLSKNSNANSKHSIQPINSSHKEQNDTSEQAILSGDFFSSDIYLSSENSFLYDNKKEKKKKKKNKKTVDHNSYIFGYSLGRDKRLHEFSLENKCVNKSFIIPSDFRPPNISSSPVAFRNNIICPSQTGIHSWDRQSGSYTGAVETSAATTCIICEGETLITAHADGFIFSWKLA